MIALSRGHRKSNTRKAAGKWPQANSRGRIAVGESPRCVLHDVDACRSGHDDGRTGRLLRPPAFRYYAASSRPLAAEVDAGSSSAASASSPVRVSSSMVSFAHS